MRALLLALTLAGGPLAADPISISPVPTPRPSQAAAEAQLIIIPVYYDATVRPRPRPTTLPVVARPQAPVVETVTSSGLIRSPRPIARPPEPAPLRVARPSGTGPICGRRDIIGASAAPIAGKLRGCGVADPVRVSQVAGIPLSRPSLMNCTTAKALRSWVEEGVKPGVGRLGGGVARINVVAHYSCRTINHRPGGEISEHGKGNAVDVSGITLRNGKTLSVEDDWRKRAEGGVLKRLHRAACGPFGTVLGPNADRFHQDHFHFDTKRRRNPYCR
ncbi:MAG: extensin family protein [Pseudomonadota bacterium]